MKTRLPAIAHGQTGLFRCCFSKMAHRAALVELLEAYMKDPMGGAAPHPEETMYHVVEELACHPSCFVLLATVEGRTAGAATCFGGYSTFSAGPAINIHDLIVLPGYRGRGLGRLLLHGAELQARACGAARVTLEVRQDNLKAQRLYSSLGFNHCTPPMWFMTRNMPEPALNTPIDDASFASLPAFPNVHPLPVSTGM